MPGKGSKARYKAMQEDVTRRVMYAFSSADHKNPYPEDDKRHARFRRELYRTISVDDDFEEMCEVHGCDTSKWTRRKYSKPGPVVPLANLA